MQGATFTTGNGTVIKVGALTPPSRTPPAAGSMQALPNGTSTGVKIGASDTSSKTFDAGMWEDGGVTGLNWSVPFSGNFKEGDAALTIVETAVTAGTEVYVTVQMPGSTTTRGGAASVMNFEISDPADGIITVTCDFKGRGGLAKVTTP